MEMDGAGRVGNASFCLAARRPVVRAKRRREASGATSGHCPGSMGHLNRSANI